MTTPYDPPSHVHPPGNDPPDYGARETSDPAVLSTGNDDAVDSSDQSDADAETGDHVDAPVGEVTDIQHIDTELVPDAPNPTGETDEQLAAKASATSLGDQDAINLAQPSLPDHVQAMVDGRLAPSPQAVRRYPDHFPPEVVEEYSKSADDDDESADDDDDFPSDSSDYEDVTE